MMMMIICFTVLERYIYFADVDVVLRLRHKTRRRVKDSTLILNMAPGHVKQILPKNRTRKRCTTLFDYYFIIAEKKRNKETSIHYR